MSNGHNVPCPNALYCDKLYAMYYRVRAIPGRPKLQSSCVFPRSILTLSPVQLFSRLLLVGFLLPATFLYITHHPIEYLSLPASSPRTIDRKVISTRSQEFIWRRTWKSKWTEAVTKLGRLWHCTSWSSWPAFIVSSSHVQECNRLVVCCSSTWLLHLADCWPDCDATRRLWGSRFRTASHRSRPPGPSPPLIPHQLTSTRSSDHSTPLYRKL